MHEWVLRESRGAAERSCRQDLCHACGLLLGLLTRPVEVCAAAGSACRYPRSPLHACGTARARATTGAPGPGRARAHEVVSSRNELLWRQHLRAIQVGVDERAKGVLHKRSSAQLRTRFSSNLDWLRGESVASATFTYALCTA